MQHACHRWFHSDSSTLPTLAMWWHKLRKGCLQSRRLLPDRAILHTELLCIVSLLHFATSASASMRYHQHMPTHNCSVLVVRMLRPLPSLLRRRLADLVRPATEHSASALIKYGNTAHCYPSTPNPKIRPHQRPVHTLRSSLPDLSNSWLEETDVA